MRTIAVVVALSLIVGCGQPKTGTPQANAPAVKKMTRDELRQKVIGLTEEQLIKEIGRPRKTIESGDDRYFFYDDLTVDTASGKTDQNIQIVFGDGKVIRVNY